MHKHKGILQNRLKSSSCVPKNKSIPNAYDVKTTCLKGKVKFIMYKGKKHNDS